MRDIEKNPYARMRPFAIVLLGLIGPVLVFHRSFLLGAVPVGGDLVSQFVPWRLFALNEIEAGRFPWWNPYVFCGTPFAANIQTSLFYPLNLLHWLIRDPARFFAFSIVFHHCLAGLSMFVWQRSRLRRQTLDTKLPGRFDWGALISALVWQWSAFFICHMHDGHLIHMRACAWLPLAFWGQDRLMERGTVVRLLACGLPFGMMVLGGHVQIPLYVAYLLVARGAVLGFAGENIKLRMRNGVRTAGITLGALAAIGGILGFLLVPLQELSAKSSARSGGANFEFASSDDLPLTHIPLLIAPFMYGDPTHPIRSHNYWGGYTGYHELIGYMGILPWCLVPFAFVKRENESKDFRRESRYWLAIIVFGFLGALGVAGGVHTVAYYCLPGYAYFRVPARLILLTILGVSVLAGQAFCAVPFSKAITAGKMTWRGWARYFPAALILIISLLVLIILTVRKDFVLGELRSLEVDRTIHEFMIPLEEAPQVAKQLPDFLFVDRFNMLTRGFSLSALFALGSLVWLTAATFWPRIEKNSYRVILCILAAALLLGDLLWFSSRFIGSGTRQEMAAMTELEIPVLADYTYPSPNGRLLMIDEVILTRDEIRDYRGLKPNRLMIHGIETVRGYDPISLELFARFANRIQGRLDDFEQGGMLRFGSAEQIGRIGYAILDVGAVISRKPVEGWEIIEHKNRRGMDLLISKNPDPHSRVMLVRNKKLDFTPGCVSILEEHPGCLRAQVLATENQMLFAWSQVDYPGWCCFVDGELHQITQFWDCFLAVELEAGAHTVEFRYMPLGFIRGASISGVTILILIFLAFWERRHGRAARPS